LWYKQGNCVGAGNGDPAPCDTKGKVKEKAGKVTNNPDLKAEGHAEKLCGKVQKKLGQMEHVLEK
jgi:uncharacterized protein YjbJ (UPF0337 family)